MTNTTDIQALRPATDSAGAVVSAPETITLSPAGERALQRKLATLREQLNVELPRRLQLAREFGDPTGNDDYMQILEEEGVIMGQIRRLIKTLDNARVVDESESLPGVVNIGSVVSMRIEDNEVRRRVVGAYEPVGTDSVSAVSPIGHAILGRSAGEALLVELPDGRSREIKIVEVAGSAS